MRINNNLMAANTWRMGIMAGNQTSKSIEKLSSGMKINKAADDAAGLAISEKMRAQIRGLNMASKNTQDGISMIQVMEGALGEVHDLLQRGRELAVQSANDTNVTIDREALNKEVQQIKTEIDRIANTTEFNTKKLLNSGPVKNGGEATLDTSGLSLEERIIYGLKSGWIEESEKLIETFYGLSASNRNLPVFLDQGTAGGMLAYVSYAYQTLGDDSTVTTLELHVELADFAPSTGESGDNTMTVAGNGKMYNDRILAHEMVHAIMADAMGDDFIDAPVWFAEGMAELIHGADDRLEADISNAGGNLQTIVDRAVALVNNPALWGTVAGQESRDYSVAYLLMKYVSENLNPGKTMKDIVSGINDDVGNTELTMATILANVPPAIGGTQLNFLNTFQANGAAYYATLDITAGSGETDTGSIAGSEYGHAALNDESVVATGQLNNTPSKFNMIFPVELDVESGTDPMTGIAEMVSIQIGSNESQKLVVELVNVSSEALSLQSVNISDLTNSSNAIKSFDQAIMELSARRSSYGAAQNRMEHALRSLDNTAENLQASESRIRDVDMAKEMMLYTKSNILVQASQAMLAQANQQGNGMLQLLR